MALVAEEHMTIDNRLRFAFFGLEIALNVFFSGAECERVFRDAEADTVSAKQYEFFRSQRLAVTGRVDAYEPEEIWIRIEGRGGGEVLRRVFDGAEFHTLRQQRMLELQLTAEQSRALEPAARPDSIAKSSPPVE